MKDTIIIERLNNGVRVKMWIAICPECGCMVPDEMYHLHELTHIEKGTPVK